MGGAILEKAPFWILNNKMDSKSYNTKQETSLKNCIFFCLIKWWADQNQNLLQYK